MFYCDITKVNDEERIVEGYASTEAIDVQGEVVKIEAIKEALPEYMRFANIREMHQPSAVGKAISADIDDRGLFLSVHVVDESAWQKVKKGVYNGFSIGGKKLSKIGDTITQLRLTEISLVDRPANPEAVFNLWKGDGMEEEVKTDIVEDVIKSDDTEKTEMIDLLKGYAGKEVFDASEALDALRVIMWLIDSERYEIADGEDSTAQIAMLKDAAEKIKQFIVLELQEKEPEVMEYSEKIEDVAKSDDEVTIEKAGASISAVNKSKLASIVKMCKEMMGEESDETEKMEKYDGMDDIKKAFELQQSEIAKMADRIKELEAMPAPSKLETAIIAKGDEETNLINMENLSASDLIKMAHKSGGKRLI